MIWFADSLVNMLVSFTYFSISGDAAAASGDVWAFGCNDSGQLGLGERAVEAKHAEPRMVRSLKGAKVVALAAGSAHSMALTSQGEVLSWGQSSFGALGHGQGEGTATCHHVGHRGGSTHVQMATLYTP